MLPDTKATAIIYFMDGTKIKFTYPRLRGKNSPGVASAVAKAIQAERIALVASGKLLVIPTRNIKYIEITPAPDSLPDTIIRDAEVR